MFKSGCVFVDRSPAVSETESEFQRLKIRNVGPKLDKCWPRVKGDDPTLN